MKILKLGQMLGGSNTPSAAGFENLYSLAFDGVNDYLTLPNDAAFTPTGTGWSMSLWIKLSAVNQFLFAKYGSAQEFYCDAKKTTGYPRIRFIGANNGTIYQQLIANIDITDGNWHHIVFTFNNTYHATSINIYVDGVQYRADLGNATASDGGSWSNITNSAEPLNFATRSGTTFYTDCNLDEMSIFDSVLSSATVTTMYNSGTPTDLTGATDIQGWWRNGDPTGTGAYPTIVDQTGNSQDGTMTNMASGDIVTDVP